VGLPPLWNRRFDIGTSALSPSRLDAPITVPNDRALAEMVQACRVIHAANLTLDPWGFVAIRDPSGRGIWVTNDAVGFNEVEVGDLVLVSISGDVVAGFAEPDSESALAVAVMSECPTVQAVVHVHSLYATAFSTTRSPLHALSHEGCHIVPPDIARVQSSGTFDERRELAMLLGERKAILLAGHGLITAAETLGEAVALAAYLEKSCRLQLMVGRGGYTVDDENVLRKRLGQTARPSISWEYLKRVTPDATVGGR
jgi:ribulose-5-phosphate 4-epimerase/fuculose-1-phosphate aldolase